MFFSYAIVANPVAGNISFDKKYELLKAIARLLNAKIYGLDTHSKQEFRECIRMLSARYDVIIAAGGDGTFSDLINSIDLSCNIAGYIPMGTGNALRYALKCPRSPSMAAMKIRYGRVRKFDIMKYFYRQYAFMASVGFEVEVIKRYQDMKHKKSSLRLPYIMAGLRAFKEYTKRHLLLSAKIYINEKEYVVRNATSIIVTKQPYYGYGMKVMPPARFDDGLLHLEIFPGGILNLIIMTISSFSIGNIMGNYFATNDSVLLNLSNPSDIHIDGDLVESASHLSFRLMPKALRVIV